MLKNVIFFTRIRAPNEHAVTKRINEFSYGSLINFSIPFSGNWTDAEAQRFNIWSSYSISLYASPYCLQSSMDRNMIGPAQTSSTTKRMNWIRQSATLRYKHKKVIALVNIQQIKVIAASTQLA